jgi:hypothetical protein
MGTAQKLFEPSIHGGIVSRREQVQKFESLESIETLDPLDIFVQIETLRNLEDGWLDGEGKAPPLDGIKWFTECFDQYYWHELRLPYLYPTEDGGICAEWVIEPLDMSLDIDLTTRRGYWHVTDFTTRCFEERDIDLNQPDSWNWLCEQIKQNGGTA